MILARIATGISDHVRARKSEWHMLYPSALVGFGLFMEPDLFDTSTAYSSVAEWMSEEWWSVWFLGVAALRLFALVVNGTFRGFRHAPLIRLIASIAAALFWLQLFGGFFNEWMASGRATIVTILLSHAVLVESMNAFWASRDMGAQGRDG